MLADRDLPEQFDVQNYLQMKTYTQDVINEILNQFLHLESTITNNNLYAKVILKGDDIFIVPLQQEAPFKINFLIDNKLSKQLKDTYIFKKQPVINKNCSFQFQLISHELLNLIMSQLNLYISNQQLQSQTAADNNKIQTYLRPDTQIIFPKLMSARQNFVSMLLKIQFQFKYILQDNKIIPILPKYYKRFYLSQITLLQLIDSKPQIQHFISEKRLCLVSNKVLNNICQSKVELQSSRKHPINVDVQMNGKFACIQKWLILVQ
ncbi:Hypothetical_protein [Hexamita inflata]|uniref:Hypothetical_protein n=1 Tax=Hexamita inflata TaxID=28002 RepID=A0AA86P6I2_9EUKA|nr:Hypothetical protein HINF_LOCUS20464 [Hexamita inflata]